MAKKDAGMTKVEMVRQALAKLGFGASAAELQQYIKDTFSTDMTIGHISQTKSSERKRQGVKGGRRRKRGRPKGSKNAKVAAASPAAVASIADILAFVSTVKEWEVKIGAATVREVLKSVTKK